jgi:hypothetical protein
MKKTKRLLASLLTVAALGLTFAPAALADPPKKNCSPGQHGNPQPGFKPGNC